MHLLYQALRESVHHSSRLRNRIRRSQRAVRPLRVVLHPPPRPRSFDPAGRETSAENPQGMGGPLQSGATAFQPGAEHPRSQDRLAADPTLRTSNSEGSSRGWQGDAGWTASRVYMAKARSLRTPEHKVVEKIRWIGMLIAVQPRIRLMRSFDQRSCASRSTAAHGNKSSRFCARSDSFRHSIWPTNITRSSPGP